MSKNHRQPPAPALAAFEDWRSALARGDKGQAAAWLARLEGWLAAPRWQPALMTRERTASSRVYAAQWPAPWTRPRTCPCRDARGPDQSHLERISYMMA
jgi:hypothetical protein